MQEKEIIVTNLSAKIINPKPGATWKAFNVYQIQGNDGITYETPDKAFFSSLTIGQKTKIRFRVETKNSNGKIYTSYKLDFPKKMDPGVADLEKKIMDRLDLLEKNIISAFKLIKLTPPKVEPIVKKKEVEENPGQLSLFPEDDGRPYPSGDEDEPPY